MEYVGFTRSMDNAFKNGLDVTTFVSDRRPTSAKHMRKNWTMLPTTSTMAFD